MAQVDLDLMDSKRGLLDRSAYIRHLIRKDAGVDPEAVGSHPIEAERVERPARIREVPRVPTSISEPAYPDNPLAVPDVVIDEPAVAPPSEVPAHRHRRGKVIGSSWAGGSEYKVYACTVAGCTETLNS